MATAEESLVARLEAVSGVTDLVSTRIYPDKLPQSATLPAITYQRISTIRETAMGNDTGIARARFQVTSFAATYAALKGVTEAVRAALQRFRGASGGVTVDDCFLENELDLYSGDEDEAGVYAVAQDFIWIHRETT